MVRETDIRDFFNQDLPLIDVRSPGEYGKGHIPGAVNIPLFSDEERAHVGTVFTQISAEKAMEVGFRYVNPKLQDFIIQSKATAPGGVVSVHCWRGGLRSRAFAGHLDKNGFGTVFIISGGYKAYRNYLSDYFSTLFKIFIIGGYTGSGKTEIIRFLEKNGHQVVDLEKLACHKGSSFGGLGQGLQPTTEQFENNLFDSLRKLDQSRPVWLEDESHNIGGVNIPLSFFNQMKMSPVFFLDIPVTRRAEYLVGEYAEYDHVLIGEAINRISRRLGGLNTRKAHEYLAEQNYYELALLILSYYDKAYLRGLRFHNPERITPIYSDKTDPAENALSLFHAYERTFIK